MTRKLFFFFLVLSSLTTFGQVNKTSALYKTIKEKDSLLFNLGFNNCDIKQFENLVSEHFEFYHDQSGIANSKKVYYFSSLLQIKAIFSNFYIH
jgi:hypothetical protein